VDSQAIGQDLMAFHSADSMFDGDALTGEELVFIPSEENMAIESNPRIVSTTVLGLR
jgi:hypothetical protein